MYMSLRTECQGKISCREKKHHAIISFSFYMVLFNLQISPSIFLFADFEAKWIFFLLMLIYGNFVLIMRTNISTMQVTEWQDIGGLFLDHYTLITDQHLLECQMCPHSWIIHKIQSCKVSFQCISVFKLIIQCIFFYAWSYKPLKKAYKH